MPRGRPRKPLAEQLKAGARPRVGGLGIEIEVFNPPGAPFVPDHLHEDAQACAEHIIRHYDAKRISSIDSYVLAVFASAWAWHKAAVHAMNDPDFQPVLPATETREARMSPWFKILNEQAHIMMQVATKLYLTPADRHVFRLSDLSQKESKFDGLIEQTASLGSFSALRSPPASDKAATST